MEPKSWSGLVWSGRRSAGLVSWSGSNVSGNLIDLHLQPSRLDAYVRLLQNDQTVEF